MKHSTRFCLLFFAFLIGIPLIGYAQEPPKVITDDYILKETKSKRLVIERAPERSPAAPAQPTQRDANAEERNWNERLKAAQERLRELNRRADEAELQINNLKNFLYSAEPRSSSEHKTTINRISELTVDLRALRAEAVRAEAQVNAVLDEGAARGFRVLKLSPVTRTGRPNTDYYQDRYNELNQELSDLRAREAVLQLRVNDISRRILINSGTGDEFYNNSLRDDKYASTDELENVRLRTADLNRKLEELREQARAVGVKLN
ncbi:MAG: hypothetical protein AB1757_09735 [Acidobacteriota bacterium]